MCQFNVLHNDHDITEDQMDFVQGYLKSMKDGFFICEIDLPVAYGTVPCALYGPACGDEPVSEDEVFYSNRGLDREWEDRMVNKPTRPCTKVQAIGIREGSQFTIFTVYGGPLAPQHPEDPSNQDPEASKEFWAEHALASGEGLV